MKKGILLLLLFLICYELTFSQESTQKKDSTAYSSNPEEYYTGNDIISEQRFDRMGIYNAIPALNHPFEDIYIRSAYNVFDVAFFKVRGYDMAYQNVCINGYSMNSPLSGNPNFSQWAGLNHLFLTPEIAIGLNSSEFSTGYIGGAVNYNVRASAYEKQTRAHYSLSNSVYDHRLMLTGATGMTKNGWSAVASLSGRFGTGMNYVKGQKFNAFSYLLAVEKKINSEHALNLTFFGAPTQGNLRAAALGEVYDVLGNNHYNPGWGWYDNKQRHANMRNSHEPVVMLSHYYTSSDKKYTVNTTLSSSFGKEEVTNLNWKNANSPWGEDIYLPSLQDRKWRSYMADQWRNNASIREIDWDNMYLINQLAAYQGKSAHYMIDKAKTNRFQLGGASNMTVKFNENIKLSAGIDIRGMKQKEQTVVDDLLGGLYWQEAYIDPWIGELHSVSCPIAHLSPQKLKEGDVRGHILERNVYTQRLWGVVNFTYNKIDFHAGAHIGGNEIFEHITPPEYLVEVIKYDINKLLSLSYGAQAGITYKINTHHRLALNAQFHLNPNLNFEILKEKVFSSEISYVIDYPIIQMRMTGFYTQFIDKAYTTLYNNTSFEITEFLINGIDQLHMGCELGLKVKAGKIFAFILAGSFGDYLYQNRSIMHIAWGQKRVAGSPQIAGTLGAEFNHKGWHANVNANYFDKIYTDIVPLINSSIFQEKLKGQFTLDLAAGKAWKFNKYTLAVNVAVKNVLNNKNLATTAKGQYTAYYQSDNYYYYALGTTFNAGINLRF